VRRRCLVVVLLASLGALSCRSVDPRGPVFPRTRGGSILVKAQIALDDVGGKCTAVVEPARIHVVRGGVVRWLVNNRCRTALDGGGRPALAVTRLTEERSRTAVEWLAKTCSAALPRVELGAPTKFNVIHCDIPDDAPLGVYKYNLEGLIEPLDPWLEVHPPG
jgi:hypothetical protein